MAIWPIFEEKDNVILVEVGKTEWEMSPDGFQMGISSGALFENANKVLEAIRGYTPKDIGEQVFLLAPAALPGSNEQPMFEYLGVYFSGIHIVPGSMKVWLNLSIAFNVSTTIAGGYNDIREFVPTIVNDARSVIDYLDDTLSPNARDRSAPSFKFYDVARPETIEKRAINEMLKGGKPGIDV
ncbi:hypothetical protein [Celeribacter halophilus]|uniref:hypothetical protein n=1 Tax=Celeribacter halophilus TaxID=576117 RepID=UPI001C087702|nr:hypothetical protein [Celeribacter halophilus]MBU2890843.1 hypothetical protein [Celeribacter halophilus]MDO6509992.1 hypothetical protein [Celeribacter halophilus]